MDSHLNNICDTKAQTKHSTELDEVRGRAHLKLSNLHSFLGYEG